MDCCGSFFENVLIDRFGKNVVLRGSDLGKSDSVMSNGANLDFLDYRDGERVSSPATK